MTIPRTWRKSRHSDGQDTCVEVRGDLGAIQDTKRRGPRLNVDVRTLVAAIRAGQI